MGSCFFRGMVGALLVASAAGAGAGASSSLTQTLQSLPDTSQQGTYRRELCVDRRAIESAHAAQRPAQGPLPESAVKSAGRWSRALGGLEKLFPGYPSHSLLALLIPAPNESPERQTAFRLALAFDEAVVLADEQSNKGRPQLGHDFDDSDPAAGHGSRRGPTGGSPPLRGGARPLGCPGTPPAERGRRL